jgi:hypothetical protein
VPYVRLDVVERPFKGRGVFSRRPDELQAIPISQYMQADSFFHVQYLLVPTYQQTVRTGGYTEVLHDSLNEIDQADLESIWQESGLNLNFQDGLPDSRRRRHIVKSWPK